MNYRKTMAAALLALSPLAGAPSALAAPATQAPADVAAEPVENVLTMPVDGRIVIEKDGSVGEYSISTPLTAGLAPSLDKAIRAWHFQPVLIDGVLVRAESRMRISLAAAKVGEDYKVHIENVVFPGPDDAKQEERSESGRVTFSAHKLKPPAYPAVLDRGQISGRVLLGLQFAPDGHVKDVVAVQTMLFNVSGGDRAMAKAIKLFEDSALLAARKWSVTMEVKDGGPLGPKDLTALTPVEYVAYSRHMEPEAPAGKWRLVSRTPMRAMPWLAGEKDLQAVGVADVEQGEMLPLAGAPRLLSPVSETKL